jgi:membrane protease YdiL (CAAX protease family)
MNEHTRTHRFDLPAVVFAIALPTVVTLVYFVLLAKAPAALQQAAYAIGKTIQFTFPVVFVWLFHRDRLSRRGVSRNAPELNQKKWILGVLFGIMVVASMAIAWFFFLSGSEIANVVVEKVNEKVAGMNLSTPLKFLALGVFYAVFHSFLEEYYWRWFVFDCLDSMTSTLNANFISSVGFAAHHVILLATFFGWSSPLTWLFSFCVGVGGAIWAWLYRSSGKLSIPWISHLIVDAGIFGLGYLIVFG